MKEPLPDESAFFNDLKNADISDADYQRACQVYNHFNCRNLKDYSLLYLKCDVLILADVFEAFRDTMMQSYWLDPAYFVSLPSYSFSACLFHTGVRLQLLTDIDMYLFFEKGIRGGNSQVICHYDKANLPACEDYNPNNPEKYLIYWNLNSMYLAAMAESLPISDFA